MSLYRVLAGVLLLGAIAGGLVVWSRTEFLYGALMFVAVAVAAGVLNNRGDRSQTRKALRDE
jgi:uncharacterized membrane protein